MTPPVRPERAPEPTNPLLRLLRQAKNAERDVVNGLGDVAVDVARAPVDLVRLIGNTVFADPSEAEASNPLMQAGRMSRMGNAPGTQMRVTGGPTPQAKAGAAVLGLLKAPVQMAQTAVAPDTPLRERVHQGVNLAALAAGAYKGAQGLSRAAAVGDEIGALGPRGGSLTNDAVRQWAEEVRARHGLDAFDVWPTREGDLKLNMIKVARDARGQGVGSKAVQDLVDYADANGKRVVLTPAVRDEAVGTTSRARLVSFYKRFGFKENKGRTRDFAISDGMVRDPQSPPR